MSSVLCCHPKASLSRSPWASSIPEAAKLPQPVSLILGSRPSTNIPLPTGLLQDQPDTDLWQSPTPIAPDTGAEAPLPAPPATPSRPRQRAASPALILTPRKVPIAHFQSCFKVTLISKLLAALAGDYSCINQGEIMPVTD